MSDFSIRVYGILMDDNKRVLVSDEYIRGMLITKFPGGGLEFGEGTRDCLAREFMEELNLKVEVGKHIYTTDFFQISAFNNKYQIISIYYEAFALEPIAAPLRENPFDFDEQQMAIYQKTGEIETPRFVHWHEFGSEQLTLPIDKIVADMVKQQY